MDKLKDVIDIMETLISIFGPLAFIFYIIKNHLKSTFFKKLYRAAYGSEYRKKEFISQKRFQSFKYYIGQSYTLYNDEEERDLKKIIQAIKKTDSRVFFISGSSGIGKTTFIQQLSYVFRNKWIGLKAEGLFEYGIFYSCFRDLEDYKELVDNINGALSRTNKDCDIYLDGFDEFSPLMKSENCEDVVKGLFDAIDEILNKPNAKRVFVTLRPEALKSNRGTGLEVLNHRKFRGNTPQIIRIGGLSKEQAIRFYKRKSKLAKEKKSIRKGNSERLQRLFDNDATHDNVFTYPFILEWTSILFQNIEDDKLLKKSNLFDILNTIEKYNFDRELKIVSSTLKLNIDDLKESFDIDKFAKDFFDYVTSVMINKGCDNTCTINKTELYNKVKQISDDNKIIDENEFEPLNMLTFSKVRCLMSITEIGNEYQLSYIHNMFFWFETARYAAKKSLQDNCFILDNKKELFNNLPVVILYYQALISLTENCIDIEYNGDSFNNSVVIKYKNSEGKEENDKFPFDKLSRAFPTKVEDSEVPNIEQVIINDVKFGSDEIEDFLSDEHIFDFNNKDENAIECLEFFSDGYVRELGISSCTDELKSKINTYSNTKLSKLEVVEIFNNVKNIEDIIFGFDLKSHPVIKVPINSTERIKLSELGCFKKINLRVESRGAFIPIYKDIYRLQKIGFNIDVLNCIVPEKYEDCSDLDVLEAVYEINKKSFEYNEIWALTEEELGEYLNVHNTIFGLIYICNKYISVLVRKKDREIVNDVINYLMNVAKTDELYYFFNKYNFLIEDEYMSSICYELLEKAAVYSPNAQCAIGEFFSRGVYVSRDNNQAFTWYKKSAENDNVWGMYYLGYCYEDGIGTEQDEKEAFSWYKKSAEKGNASGINNLGCCYAHGIGTEQDEKEAFTWYRKSAEKGNVSGMINLGYCFEHGIGTEQDETMALYWYDKAKLSNI